MRWWRAARTPATSLALPALALLAMILLPAGCARAGSPAVSTPAAGGPGRLHTLTSGTLPGFLSAFDEQRDTLRYIVVFSPT